MIPKNIRQIGEGDSSRKVYIEDYVITFLKQVQKKLSGDSRSVSLYGNIFDENGTTYVIVKGASAPADKEKYFKNAAVVGQAVIMRESGGLGKVAQMSGMMTADSPRRSVYYEIRTEDSADAPIHRNDIFECSSLFFLENGKLEPLKTYCLFYEKNDAMQEYLIEYSSKGQEIKTENAGDNAVSTFRKNYYEKQEFFMQKKIMSCFYILSGCMLIISCVIGISMINSYSKMKNLEMAMSHLAEAMDEQKLPDPEAVQEADGINAADWIQDTAAQGGTDSGADTAAQGGTDSGADTAAQGGTDSGADTAARGGTDSSADTAAQDGTDSGAGAAGQAGIDRQNGTDADTAAQDQTEAVTAAGGQVYVVQEGDTLANISRKFYNTNQKVDEICDLNHITNPNKIVMGEKIILP